MIMALKKLFFWFSYLDIRNKEMSLFPSLLSTVEYKYYFFFFLDEHLYQFQNS